jgi:hypothetical protein
MADEGTADVGEASTEMRAAALIPGRAANRLEGQLQVELFPGGGQPLEVRPASTEIWLTVA